MYMYNIIYIRYIYIYTHTRTSAMDVRTFR